VSAGCSHTPAPRWWVARRCAPQARAQVMVEAPRVIAGHRAPPWCWCKGAAACVAARAAGAQTHPQRPERRAPSHHMRRSHAPTTPSRPRTRGAHHTAASPLNFAPARCGHCTLHTQAAMYRWYNINAGNTHEGTVCAAGTRLPRSRPHAWSVVWRSWCVDWGATPPNTKNVGAWVDGLAHCIA
jgi:hypothetical protein